MKKSIFIGILCLFLGSQVKAQFSLSGEFRPRTEYSHGYSTLAAEDQKASLPNHYSGQRWFNTAINAIISVSTHGCNGVLHRCRIYI